MFREVVFLGLPGATLPGPREDAKKWPGTFQQSPKGHSRVYCWSPGSVRTYGLECGDIPFNSHTGSLSDIADRGGSISGTTEFRA